jgi:hypothetical protein
MMIGNTSTLRVNLVEDYSPDFENMTPERAVEKLLYREILLIVEMKEQLSAKEKELARVCRAIINR